MFKLFWKFEANFLDNFSSIPQYVSEIFWFLNSSKDIFMQLSSDFSPNIFKIYQTDSKFF